MTSGVGPISQNINPFSGICKMINKEAIPKAMAKERDSSMVTSVKSRRPNAWAVIPLAPMRRNPKSQYTRLKIIEPTATAPI